MFTLQTLSLQQLIKENRNEELNRYIDLEVDTLTYDILLSSKSSSLFNICDRNAKLSKEQKNIIIHKCPIELLYVLIYKIKNLDTDDRLNLLRHSLPNYIYKTFKHIENPTEEEIVYAMNNICENNVTQLYNYINKKYAFNKHLNISQFDLKYVSYTNVFLDYCLLKDILNRTPKDSIKEILNIINPTEVLTVYEYIYFNHDFNDIVIKQINKIALTRCTPNNVKKIFDLISKPNKDEIDIAINRCEKYMAFQLFLQIENIDIRQINILRQKVREDNILYFDTEIETAEDLILGFNRSYSIKEMYLFVHIDNAYSKILVDCIKDETITKMLYAINLFNPLSVKELIKINRSMIHKIYHFFNKPSKEIIKEMIVNLHGNDLIELKKYIKQQTHLSENEMSEINKELWNYYIGV